MTEKCKVTKTDGDFAEVVFIRKSACSANCASCGGCKDEKEHRAIVKNKIGAKVNDIAIVYTKDSALISAIFLVMILPIIIFLGGYVLLSSLLRDTLLSGILSFLICLCFVFVLKKIDKKIAPMPEIVEITYSKEKEKADGY